MVDHVIGEAFYAASAMQNTCHVVIIITHLMTASKSDFLVHVKGGLHMSCLVQISLYSGTTLVFHMTIKDRR